MNGLSGKPRHTLGGTGPKGVVIVNDTMRAAVRQVREGAHRLHVAQLYGVSINAVNAWVLKVGEFEREERLAGMGLR